ncbi:hypothetical protein ACRQ5Q_14985 [Bradyrhizobium sp. PMVTL-01]|uniref:hypothetical protein n=1 Tax=Bradyrhizobium sp. PMVTL-01 TaxID=3434999 RepID=UPI003F71E703
MIRWRDIKVDGKPACFVDIDSKRLYINQRNDGAFCAFVDGRQIGQHYATVSAAQAAALREIGVKPPPDPLRFSTAQAAKRIDADAPLARLEADGTTITFLSGDADAAPPAEVLPSGRKKPVREETAAQLAAFPIADMSKPATIVNDLGQTYQFAQSAPHSETVVDLSVQSGHCSCGTKLGRSGRCPALCTPVEKDPPPYTGPRLVGRTHTARLGAPVSW